jgi:hypothetical protein
MVCRVYTFLTLLRKTLAHRTPPYFRNPWKLHFAVFMKWFAIALIRSHAKGDASAKQAALHVRRTWDGIFPPNVLAAIDSRTRLSERKPPNSIHINPNFVRTPPAPSFHPNNVIFHSLATNISCSRHKISLIPRGLPKTSIATTPIRGGGMPSVPARSLGLPLLLSGDAHHHPDPCDASTTTP